MDEDLELYHYGVKGMKWGIRRTPEQLGRKINKLDNKNAKLTKKLNPNDTIKARNYASKSAKYKSKASKHSMKARNYGDLANRLNGSDRDGAYTRGAEDAARSNQQREARKAAKYTKKASRYQLKYNKINDKQNAVKAKINKNKALQSMYRSTIRDLNSDSIKKGRLFMQYSYEYN